MKMWSLYIVECSDGTLYTGISNDVEKRVKAHNTGKGAKYTRSRLPVILRIFVECGTRSEASKFEWIVKQLARNEKISHVERVKKYLLTGSFKDVI